MLKKKKKDCFAQPKAKLSNTIQSTPTQINEEYDAEYNGIGLV